MTGNAYAYIRNAVLLLQSVTIAIVIVCFFSIIDFTQQVPYTCMNVSSVVVRRLKCVLRQMNVQT